MRRRGVRPCIADSLVGHCALSAEGEDAAVIRANDVEQDASDVADGAASKLDRYGRVVWTAVRLETIGQQFPKFLDGGEWMVSMILRRPVRLHPGQRKPLV